MCVFFIVKWIKETHTAIVIETDEEEKKKLQYNPNKWLKLKSNEKKKRATITKRGHPSSEWNGNIFLTNFVLLLTEYAAICGDSI